MTGASDYVCSCRKRLQADSQQGWWRCEDVIYVWLWQKYYSAEWKRGVLEERLPNATVYLITQHQRKTVTGGGGVGGINGKYGLSYVTHLFRLAPFLWELDLWLLGMWSRAVVYLWSWSELHLGPLRWRKGAKMVARNINNFALGAEVATVTSGGVSDLQLCPAAAQQPAGKWDEEKNCS